MKRPGDWHVAHDTLVNVYLLVRTDASTGNVERKGHYVTRHQATRACQRTNRARRIRQAKNRAEYRTRTAKETRNAD